MKGVVLLVIEGRCWSVPISSNSTVSRKCRLAGDFGIFCRIGRIVQRLVLLKISAIREINAGDQVTKKIPSRGDFGGVE